jgi:CubicO group peptidase (beta-lactamase class C family)
MRYVLLVPVLIVFVVGCLAQKRDEIVADDERVRKIDTLLTSLEKDGLDGVMLIRSRDRILFHKAYGMADRRTNLPMRVGTGFDIGSIVKPFTKAAILKLEEQGKLSTADTLAKYFTNVPDDKKSITIDQIIAHTSGLPDAFGSDYNVVTKEWLLEKVLAAPLVSVPGEKRNYSNSGYAVLAMIIEKVSGQPYEKYLRQEIFVPAGTKSIGYRLAGWKNADLAVGYWEDKPWGTPLDKKWAEDGPSWNLRGNGGMLATVAETSAWFEAIIEGKVLKPAALKKFLDTTSGVSRTLGARMISVAGGNDVFNAVQVSVVDSDFHFHFATSNAKQSAEAILPKFRDDLFALAKDTISTK